MGWGGGARGSRLRGMTLENKKDQASSREGRKGVGAEEWEGGGLEGEDGWPGCVCGGGKGAVGGGGDL